MTTAEVNHIKSKITATLNTHAGVAPSVVANLLMMSNGSLQGKLYEADVLSKICEELNGVEGCKINFVGGTNLTLRQKGGEIDKVKYPYFKISRGGRDFGELFTDIYFKSLSSMKKPAGSPQTYGDYHELDIALLAPGVIDKPEPAQVYLAVECKNRKIEKYLIRELLGFRRELSLLSTPKSTEFDYSFKKMLNADPASVHILFVNDKQSKIDEFAPNCEHFGTLIRCHKM